MALTNSEKIAIVALVISALWKFIPTEQLWTKFIGKMERELQAQLEKERTDHENEKKTAATSCENRVKELQTKLDEEREVWKKDKADLEDKLRTEKDLRVVEKITWFEERDKEREKREERMNKWEEEREKREERMNKWEEEREKRTNKWEEEREKRTNKWEGEREKRQKEWGDMMREWREEIKQTHKQLLEMGAEQRQTMKERNDLASERAVLWNSRWNENGGKKSKQL